MLCIRFKWHISQYATTYLDQVCRTGDSNGKRASRHTGCNLYVQRRWLVRVSPHESGLHRLVQTNPQAAVQYLSVQPWSSGAYLASAR